MGIPASRQSCGEGPPCWLGPTTSCPAPPQGPSSQGAACRYFETNLGGGRLPAYEMITRFCSGRSLLFKSFSDCRVDENFEEKPQPMLPAGIKIQSWEIFQWSALNGWDENECEFQKLVDCSEDELREKKSCNGVS